MVPLGRLGWYGKALGAGGIYWDWALGHDNIILESEITLKFLEMAQGYTGRHWSILETEVWALLGATVEETTAKTGEKGMKEQGKRGKYGAQMGKK